MNYSIVLDNKAIYASSEQIKQQRYGATGLNKLIAEVDSQKELNHLRLGYK